MNHNGIDIYSGKKKEVMQHFSVLFWIICQLI